MKIIKYVILISLFIITTAIARENYWEKFKSNSNKKSFMENLTAKELILMGQDCSVEAEKECPDSIFCERNTYALIFFFYEYPKKNGLKNLDLIFNEVGNKSLSNFWRASLIEFLGDNDWLILLNSDELYSIMNKLAEISSNPNEHPRMRYEALESSINVLEQIEKNNLLTEPIIQSKMENGAKLRELRKEIFASNIVLSDNYKHIQNKTLKYYKNYTQSILPILNEPNLDPIVMRGVLQGLKTSYEKEIETKSQIENALKNAIRNYAKYDKENWRHLARIGVETFNLPDANQIIVKMLSDMQNQLERETEKKARNQLRGEIDSLKRIQKTSEKEKRARSDPNNSNSAAKDANLPAK